MGDHLVPLRPRAKRQQYAGDMGAKPVLTGDELVERLRHAPPPTPDDVSITADGRRLDSAEAVRAWWAELEAERAKA